MGQPMGEVSERETKAFPYLFGASSEGDHTVFTVTASAEDKAALLLYHENEKEAFVRLPFPEEGWGNLRRLTVTGIMRDETQYCLEIGGEEMADPCGRIVCGRPAFGQGHSAREKELYHGRQAKETTPHRHSVLRSGFLTEGYDWEEDRLPARPWNETVLYQLHVRGFTMDSSSGVQARGTFGGLVEKLPYLQKLGITAVELQPAYDFDENGIAGPVNYWGYTGGYFFAPKSAYCEADSSRPCDVQFKDMVKACHRAGIEVIMQFYFPQETQPGLAKEALRFWAMEYHVDGFRVMGCYPGSELMRDPVLAGRKLLGDGWEGGDRQGMTASEDSGFTEVMRRVLRGDEEQLQPLIFHIKNNSAVCPPIHCIAEYSGFTLKDLVSYETKHNEANGESNRDGTWYNYSDNCGKEGPTEDEKIRRNRLRQRENALLFVFLSQGVPMIQAGDEFGHTKGGNNNAWCQDNKISWLNWESGEAEDGELLAFTRALIAFRREHGVFRQRTEVQCTDYASLGMPDLSLHGVHPWLVQYENFRRQLGVLYNGAYAQKQSGGPDDSYYVMFNFHSEPHEFNLPKAPGGGEWYVKADTAAACVWAADGQEKGPEEVPFTVAPRSIVILTEKEKKREQKKAKRKRKS